MTTVVGDPSRPLQYAKAIAQSDLPTGTRATCWAIGTFANNNSGRAFPTVRTIAEATGLSEPVVSKHTAIAESRGYLHKERRFNGSIVYTITVPPLDVDEVIESLAEDVEALPAPVVTNAQWLQGNLRVWPQLPV
ncbi:DNA-binding transcriptional ArsR family regulator [Arthrobacter sp. UYCu512]|uniref:helix-turn-helix domain-containing protein n=1 Tax=Arthrobacter sp. UYCu512 TaxID=3156338 RepID=UPI0033964A17